MKHSDSLFTALRCSLLLCTAVLALGSTVARAQTDVELQAIEKEKGEALDIKDIIEQVAGIYPKVMIDGDVESGAWSCGMVAGLIHDVPTCQALIDRIMLQAEQLIRQRLVLALN